MTVELPSCQSEAMPPFCSSQVHLVILCRVRTHAHTHTPKPASYNATAVWQKKDCNRARPHACSHKKTHTHIHMYSACPSYLCYSHGQKATPEEDVNWQPSWKDTTGHKHFSHPKPAFLWNHCNGKDGPWKAQGRTCFPAALNTQRDKQGRCYTHLATCENASTSTDSNSFVNSGPFFLLFWMTSFAKYKKVSFLLDLAGKGKGNKYRYIYIYIYVTRHSTRISDFHVPMCSEAKIFFFKTTVYWIYLLPKILLMKGDVPEIPPQKHLSSQPTALLLGSKRGLRGLCGFSVIRERVNHFLDLLSKQPSLKAEENENKKQKKLTRCHNKRIYLFTAFIPCPNLQTLWVAKDLNHNSGKARLSAICNPSFTDLSKSQQHFF